MAEVIDVANYILEISRDDSGDGEYELISHMKLQKLVYFCQGYSLALFNKPLFPETIEAWEHGPVCPKLYKILKAYGSSPITAVVDPDKIKLEESEKQLINMVYSKYGQYSASRLRAITHNEGPWNRILVTTEIPIGIMAEYFLSLIEVKAYPSSNDEKKDLLNILEQAEANGEIDLSQYCIPMDR